MSQILKTDGLIDYVDNIHVNPNYTLDNVSNELSTVSICSGSNEGYYIDISLYEESELHNWCSIRTHSDLDDTIKIHQSITRHYLK